MDVFSGKSLKFLFIIGFSITLLSMAGCKDGNNQEAESLTYDEYVTLYQEMSQEFLPPDLSKVPLKDKIAMIAVDKKASFGKRNFLTVSGEQSERVTQRRIAYENTNKKHIVFLDLIYLNKPLDNDLIYWNSHSIDKFRDNALLKKFNDNILSYHNILIKITMFSEGEQTAAASGVVRETTLAVVDFLSAMESR